MCAASIIKLALVPKERILTGGNNTSVNRVHFRLVYRYEGHRGSLPSIVFQVHARSRAEFVIKRITSQLGCEQDRPFQSANNNIANVAEVLGG